MSMLRIGTSVITIQKRAYLAWRLLELGLFALLGSPFLAYAQHQALLAVAMPAQDAVNLYEVNGPQIKLKKSIAVGKGPSRMCVDPARHNLYVVTATGVVAVDLATSSQTATMTDTSIKNPYSCLVSADARKLYLTDRDANTVFVFALPSHQLLKKLAVPEDVRMGIYTPGNKEIVFSCGDAGALAVVDPATDGVKRTIKTVSLDPRNMVITPDGKYLAVALVSSDLLSFYRADTLEPVNSFGVTRSPQGFAIAPDGERIYVGGVVEGVIAVVDMREKNHEGVGEWRQSSTIPTGPASSVAISPDGNYIYASPTDGVGTIVDLRSWKILKPTALKGAGSLIYIME